MSDFEQRDDIFLKFRQLFLDVTDATIPIDKGSADVYVNKHLERIEHESRKQEIESAIKKVSKTEKDTSNESTTKFRPKLQETVVFVDSRNRNIKLYPDPNNFSVDLGRVFKDVTQIRILSTEFPNSDNVIKSTNNVISWVNQEDFDLDFPVYQAVLRTGFYTAQTLQAELSTKMNALKRRNGTSDFHYFIISIDITSDIVTFISLLLTSLDNAPLNTVRSSSIITVNHPAHGFLSGQIIYFVNATTVGGISSYLLNNQKFEITVTSTDTYTVEVPYGATDTVKGGGNKLKIGILAPFKFLWGDYKNNPSDKLGFASTPLENTSDYINTVQNPLRSRILSLNGAMAGNPTALVINNHKLRSGDEIKLINFFSTPTLLDPYIVKVVSVIDANTFVIDQLFTKIDSDRLQYCTVLTNILTLTFDHFHGFNTIGSITSTSMSLTIVTVYPHGLLVNQRIYLRSTNSNPSVDGSYIVATVVDSYTFTVASNITIITPGSSGLIGGSVEFNVYGVDNFFEYDNAAVSDTKFGIRDLIDEYSLTFSVPGLFISKGSSFGGLTTRISSNVAGFRGIIANNDNYSHAAIVLSGENFVFLCSDTIGFSQSNGAKISNIFYKILLSGQPGEVIFNTFVGSPAVFNQPIGSLNTIPLQVRINDGSLYDFNRLDYSFSIGITEIQDENVSTIVSSNRPIYNK